MSAEPVENLDSSEGALIASVASTCYGLDTWRASTLPQPGDAAGSSFANPPALLQPQRIRAPREGQLTAISRVSSRSDLVLRPRLMQRLPSEIHRGLTGYAIPLPPRGWRSGSRASFAHGALNKPVS